METLYEAGHARAASCVSSMRSTPGMQFHQVNENVEMPYVWHRCAALH
jgi:hypothetical protein